MGTSRLEQLRKYYEEDPADPFNIYALALEYLKSDGALAKRYFDELLENHPGYVATYYHAAKFYAESGDTSKAERLYEKGIEVARKAGDTKAARELRSALDELLF